MKSVFAIRVFALTLFLSSFGYLISCQPVTPATTPQAPKETIGVAHLNEDGLLEITLRATGNNGVSPVGDAYFVYREGTSDYKEFMKLVGGLKRGETKSIPASPKANPSAN